MAEKNEKPKEDKNIKLTFDVNGQQHKVNVKASSTIGDGAKVALEKTGNNTDLARWEVTKSGQRLNFDTTVAAAGLKDDDVLVLSNKPGTKA